MPLTVDTFLDDHHTVVARVGNGVPLSRSLDVISSGGAGNELPSLLPQEVEGKAQYVRVLCCLIGAPPAIVDEHKREDARRQLTQLVKRTLDEYLAWTAAEPRVATPVDATRRAVWYADLLASILVELSEFDGPEIRRHLPWLYPLLNELVVTPNAQVRAALALVYAKSIGQLLPL